MNTQTRRLRYFFSGQHFSDGVRITLAILLPALVLSQLGHFEMGLTVSTGAVCVSVTDTPGPGAHRRNGLLAALGLIFITALLTGVTASNVWLLGPEVAALSFLFTMFLVWGARAGAVGTAALLNVVLLLAHPPTLGQVLPHASGKSRGELSPCGRFPPWCARSVPEHPGCHSGQSLRQGHCPALAARAA